MGTETSNQSFPLLDNLLPEGQHLTFEKTERVLSLLTIKDEKPTIITHKSFSANEAKILVALLESYPYPAPYDILLASLTDGNLAFCRQRLQSAQRNGKRDQEIRPVKDTVMHIRRKLRSFPLLIPPGYETGYAIIVSPSS